MNILGGGIFAMLSWTAVSAVALSYGVSYLVGVADEYKKRRELQYALDYFKVITSNLCWENKYVLNLVEEAIHYKFTDTESYHQTVEVLALKLNTIMEGSEKYKDGSVVKAFNERDEDL